MKTKQQSRAPHTKRRPLAEDHDRQGDKTAPVGHVAFKGSDGLQRQVGPSQSCNAAAYGDIQVADQIYVDTNCVRRARMLADGAGAQTPAGEEQEIVHYEYQDQRSVGDGRIAEQDAPDERECRQWSQWNRLELTPGSETLLVEIAGQAKRQNIDDRAADNLIHFERDRHEGQKRTEQRAGQNTGHDGQDQVAGVDIRQKADEGSQKHLSFDADVDHARSLAEQATQCAEHKRGGLAKRGGQDGGGDIPVNEVTDDHTDGYHDAQNDTESAQFAEQGVKSKIGEGFLHEALLQPWPQPVLRVTFSPSSARMRMIQRTIMSAETKNRMRACTTSMIWAATWASNCIRLLPACIAPTRMAAGITPSG